MLETIEFWVSYLTSAALAAFTAALVTSPNITMPRLDTNGTAAAAFAACNEPGAVMSIDGLVGCLPGPAPSTLATATPAVAAAPAPKTGALTVVNAGAMRQTPPRTETAGDSLEAILAAKDAPPLAADPE